MSRRWYVMPAAVAVSLLVVACDEPPTAPQSAARPLAAVAGDFNGAPVLAQDLGVLPGDVESEATFITEDGVVYGRSYATALGTGTPRFFRWTAGGGMTQVSSIPAPPTAPIPALGPLPPPYIKALELAANFKGEATGQLCWFDCDSPFLGRRQNLTHVFRSSGGAGVVEIDTRRQESDEDPSLLLPRGTSHGRSINRWGHIAGTIYLLEGDDPNAFFWTPVDSFWIGPRQSVEDTVRVNDIDQVMGHTSDAVHTCAFAWRPDLGVRLLVSPVSCTDGLGEEDVRANAQQRNGTFVVGLIPTAAGPRHAALWRVPAVNRAAFPSVNAKLYTTSSTLRLQNGSVLYYLTYKATQATASGPYTEVVDWGDGTSSRRTRLSLSPIYAAKHTYTKAAVYWVRVYVKDSQGRWGVDERKVTVTQ